MCVAVPLLVLQIIDDDHALVEQGDTVYEVNIRLLPDVAEGEYLLVNLGVAVQKVSEEEAEAILDLWDQVTLSLTEEYPEEYPGELKEQNE